VALHTPIRAHAEGKIRSWVSPGTHLCRTTSAGMRRDCWRKSGHACACLSPREAPPKGAVRPQESLSRVALFITITTRSQSFPQIAYEIYSAHDTSIFSPQFRNNLGFLRYSHEEIQVRAPFQIRAYLRLNMYVLVIKHVSTCDQINAHLLANKCAFVEEKMRIYLKRCQDSNPRKPLHIFDMSEGLDEQERNGRVLRTHAAHIRSPPNEGPRCRNSRIIPGGLQHRKLLVHTTRICGFYPRGFSTTDLHACF
jgi:hypothetical protein